METYSVSSSFSTLLPSFQPLDLQYFKFKLFYRLVIGCSQSVNFFHWPSVNQEKKLSSNQLCHSGTTLIPRGQIWAFHQQKVMDWRKRQIGCTYSTFLQSVSLHLMHLNRLQSDGMQEAKSFSIIMLGKIVWKLQALPKMYSFFTAEKHKYSVCRSNSQRDRHLKLDKVGKSCTVTLNHKNKAAHSPSAFLPANKDSFLLILTWRRFAGFLLWAVSCEKRNCDTLSCSLYPQREFSRSGNGIFKWGRLSFLRKSGAGTSHLKTTGWNERGSAEVNSSALVWDRLWNFPSSSCRQRRRKNLILGQSSLLMYRNTPQPIGPKAACWLNL